jgi:hypothetical protein
MCKKLSITINLGGMSKVLAWTANLDPLVEFPYPTLVLLIDSIIKSSLKNEGEMIKTKLFF